MSFRTVSSVRALQSALVRIPKPRVRRCQSTSSSSSPRYSSWALPIVGGATTVSLIGFGVQYLPAKKASIKDEGGISAEALRQHTRLEDLWVAIDGNVYNVSDFAPNHPGGSDILVQHAGQDVTKLFKAIHPANTLEEHLTPDQKVGPLSESAIESLKTSDPETEKIEEARAKLFGVDSVVSIDDFEVRTPSEICQQMLTPVKLYAKDILPAHAWYYYSTGADGEHSMRNNHDAYSRVYFRPRVMRNVSHTDTSTTILGVKGPLPIYVSPTARNGLGQSLGEVAVTIGAGKSGILQVLSHFASKSLDDVMKARQDRQQIGWQIYMDADRARSALDMGHNGYDHCEGTLGFRVLLLTSLQLGKRERERKASAQRKPVGESFEIRSDRCQAANGAPLTRSIPSHGHHADDITWDDIKWIRKLAPGLPIVLKGIGAWEDIVLAKKHGVDAVVLSNHGGRQLDYAQSPLETLRDLQVNSPSTLKDSKMQVFVDGGVRHGTDILKALCLGASGVGLGRPFIYAATGWGPEGVEKAVMILQEEMTIGMKLLGVNRIDELNPSYLDTSKL
ncbi:L-lactate dehydrogenase (cytochrome), partial [Tremellales sp. Uapishka_1]